MYETKGNTVGNAITKSPFLSADPNTQILYACDSCGDKFLDASSLAQHVRIHTAQALVMFQADSDFYQYTAADGDAAATWQPTAEQVIQDGEHVLHTEGGPEADEGIAGETQEEEKRAEGAVDEEGREDREVESHVEIKNEDGVSDSVQCENGASEDP